MARGGALAGLALIALFALSCGESSKTPIAGPPVVPPLPERVEAVFPAARSQGVFYDTPIWVQFSMAVDTATINERTVFLKADTERLAAAIAWDPATRRLRITPVDRLALRRTHTVELAASIRFVDGITLGQLHAWQFTTNSLRRPQSPLPMHGVVEQSPFVALRWEGLTEPSAGPITYEIHAGPDSATAVDPALPAVGSAGATLFVPRVRWRQDGPNYWSIHTRNGATGERLVGPAWRFDTFPADAAYDSFTVAVIDWNWVLASDQGRQRCTEDSLVMAPNIVSTIRWNFGTPDTNVRLVGVAIEMTPRYASHPAIAGPSVWSANSSFQGCAHGFPGPPSTDEVSGKLADAAVVSSTRIRFASDALTAHVEATRRLGGLYGYLFRAGLRRAYFGPGAGSPTVKAVMWVYTYRPDPAPLAGARSDR